MALITCPYCLSAQSSNKDVCENPDCKKMLPKQYIEGALVRAPLWLGTYGISAHGKTSLLKSMTNSLEHAYKISQGAFHTYLDDATRLLVANWRQMERDGQTKVPSTNLLERPLPFLFQLKNFPPKQTNLFIIYDLSGEVADRAGSDPQYIKPLRNCKTIWFIVDLDALYKDTSGRSMVDLYNVFQQGMDQLGIAISDRNIIVTYTKADLLFMMMDSGQIRFSPNIVTYLADDPYQRLKETSNTDLKSQMFDENRYFQEMSDISNELRTFTEEEIPGGGAFISMVEDTGAHVYFTLNSAYGSNPLPDGRQGQVIARQRVLDPLLWAIKLGVGDNGKNEAALILPPEVGTVYDPALVLRFYESLMRNGSITTTYYTGESQGAFSAGTVPNRFESGNRLPLVGPALDHLDPKTAVVLLAENELPIDIDDFADTKLANQLLVISPSREARRPWLHHFGLLKPDTDVESLVKDFIKKLQ